MFKNIIKIEYTVQKREKPDKLIEVGSAWQGMEEIIGDILGRFQVPRKIALEFGVEYGYSIVALSNFFEKVIGVDHFKGDEQCGFKADSFYEDVKNQLTDYKNIELVKANYLDFIRNEKKRFDLIHIDISHDYLNTLACGLWAVKYSDIVLFHDTESFLTVKEAILEICYWSGFNFYNYREKAGLGIVTNKKL